MPSTCHISTLVNHGMGGLHLVKTDNTIFVAWLCPFNIAFHNTLGLDIWAIFVLSFLCSFQSQTPSSNSYPMHRVLPTLHVCWLGLRVRGHFFKKGCVPVILSDIIHSLDWDSWCSPAARGKWSCFFKFCLCPAFLLTESDRKSLHLAPCPPTLASLGLFSGQGPLLPSSTSALLWDSPHVDSR